MMYLLPSANDAILVALTFMLPLEFDSNLRRYSFAFCESELLANNSSLATFATNIRFAMYIKCWFGSFTDFILLVLMFLPFGGMCILLQYVLFRLSIESV